MKAKTTQTTDVKAIIFARVSTTEQDYSRQYSDLLPLALKDGYKQSEIAVIAHKESASKNDVYNRKSITELQGYISAHNIETVYVAEISRLARRSDVMYNVMALLEEHGICLTVQTPTLLRTMENGKTNPFAHVIIAFLAQVAQQETEIKNERVKSGRAQKIRDGKLISKPVFGYTRNADGYAVVNPSQSEIVKDVYALITDGCTAYEVAKKYEHSELIQGVAPASQAARKRIYHIIQKVHYKGENNYPAIVTPEQWQSANEALTNGRTKAKAQAKTKFDYLCKRIVYSGGHLLTGCAVAGKPSYKNKRFNLAAVNAPVVDLLAWQLAVQAKAQNDSTVNAEMRRNAEKQLPALTAKGENIQRALSSIAAKLDRANDLYINGTVSRQKYENTVSKINAENARLLDEQNAINIQVAQLQNTLKATVNDAMRPAEIYNNLLDITDPVAKAEIVHETIKAINVKRCDDSSRGNTKIRLEVTYHNPALNTPTYYIYHQKGCTKHLYECNDADGVVYTTDLTPAKWA